MPVDFLIIGKTGWIGPKLAALVESRGLTYEYAEFRMENRGAVLEALDRLQPKHVLNAAGITGRPNVDWCETHRPETIRANVTGTLNLLDCCAIKGIHVTNFATGCIYHYDEGDFKPTREGGRAFTESDPPNFTGSFYSKTKAMVQELIIEFPNVLHLRLRMPVSDDLHHRNLITKITGYEKVVNIPNSMSILTELLPVAVDMSLRDLTGMYNFCNPGAICHNEVLDLYREFIDPEFKYQNFSLEEQEKVISAPRSNCELDASKLIKANPGAEINDIQLAMRKVFERMKINLGK
mmetsp:Transcript_13413/g.34094  ORF Transcript_13413/g.34094 Transcript_13413/m.34094 type:complete len:294 (-) Transcript_13413:273-1154(-)